jgi:hypothetical protein
VDLYYKNDRGSMWCALRNKRLTKGTYKCIITLLKIVMLYSNECVGDEFN